jgi:Ni,Fe-hydrogenase I large subunit
MLKDQKLCRAFISFLNYIHQQNLPLSESRIQKSIQSKQGLINSYYQAHFKTHFSRDDGRICLEYIQDLRNNYQIKPAHEIFRAPQRSGMYNSGNRCYTNALFQSIALNSKFVTDFLEDFKQNQNHIDQNLSPEQAALLRFTSL